MGEQKSNYERTSEQNLKINTICCLLVWLIFVASNNVRLNTCEYMQKPDVIDTIFCLLIYHVYLMLIGAFKITTTSR